MILSTDVLLYISITILVILVVWIVRLEIKLKRILGNGTAKNFEDLIRQNNKNINELQDFMQNSLGYFKDVENRLKRSVQAVETIRFNPFKGTGAGGNQSFSTVFTSENGDGVVLSSLHSRDRVSIFSKPIKKFASEFELSAEEKNVTTRAKQSLKSIEK